MCDPATLTLAGIGLAAAGAAGKGPLAAPGVPDPQAPPVELEAPELELGADQGSGATRRRAATGRNALRTGLNIPSGGAAGLSIPSS